MSSVLGPDRVNGHCYIPTPCTEGAPNDLKCRGTTGNHCRINPIMPPTTINTKLYPSAHPLARGPATFSTAISLSSTNRNTAATARFTEICAPSNGKNGFFSRTQRSRANLVPPVSASLYRIAVPSLSRTFLRVRALYPPPIKGTNGYRSGG